MSVFKVGSSSEIIAANGQGPKNMTLVRYVEQHLGNTSSTGCDTYLFDRGQFFSSPEALPLLNRMFEPSSLLYNAPPSALLGFVMDQHADEAVASAYDVYLLLGGNQTGVTFHSHAASVVALHAGQKRWFLFPPDTRPVPRHHDPRGMRVWQPDAGLVASMTTFVQEEGDVVYVPEGWYHATLNEAAVTLATAHQRRVPEGKAARYENLANQLRAQGRLDEALEVHLQLLAEFPKSSVGYRSLALVLSSQAATDEQVKPKKLAQALTLLEKAMALDPTDELAAGYFCNVALQLGQDAYKACAKAVLLNPFSADYAFRHGVSLLNLGRGAEASEVFKTATSLDAGHTQALFHRANLAAELDGDMVQAVDLFQSALASLDSGTEPGLASAIHMQLGIALLQLGSQEEALKHLKTAASSDKLRPAIEPILRSIKEEL